MELLINRILNDLIVELDLTDDKDKRILKIKVRNAISEVQKTRNFPKTYNQEDIVSDLSGHYTIIHNLALYDFNQIGAEGQTSHNENGVSRSWQSREKILNGVIPFAKII